MLMAKCPDPLCNCAIAEVKWSDQGSCLFATMFCSNNPCHETVWSSQPPASIAQGNEDRTRRGNVEIVAAAVTTGLGFEVKNFSRAILLQCSMLIVKLQQLHQFSNALHMPMMSKKTFYGNQTNYIAPAIESLYIEEMDSTNAQLKEIEHEVI
jgi:hypothetical protein